MKSLIIIILVAVAIALGFSVYSLQKELLNVKEDAELFEKRNEDLQRDLMRINRLYAEKERVLSGIEEAVSELDSKIDLKTLEKHIPKKTWGEIEPVIDKLKAFQQNRENEKKDDR